MLSQVRISRNADRGRRVLDIRCPERGEPVGCAIDDGFADTSAPSAVSLLSELSAETICSLLLRTVSSRSEIPHSPSGFGDNLIEIQHDRTCGG